MKFFTHVLPATLITFAVTVSTPAFSDDTEIYFAEAKADDDKNTPAANVLFLIDTSGSMCQYDGGGSNQNCGKSTSRMNKLKQAFNIMVEGVDEKVSLGLAKFNGGRDTSAYGGYVFYPMSKMDGTKQSDIKSVVNDLTGSANTPLMEAYTESARYMLGMSPTDYAKRGEAIQDSPQKAINITEKCTRSYKGYCYEYDYVSSDQYESPMDMENQCETNHIVVMTDGEPTYDDDYSSSKNITGDSCSGSYDCQIKLARFLAGEKPKGKKPVKTWQIGFGINQTSGQAKNMQAVAKAGGTEKVYFADSADELADAFIEVMKLIDKDSRSITSPGVAVSQTNRFQNLDELYYAIFQPAESSYWEGNLKRYRMDSEKDRIVDSNNKAAVDDTTSRFAETSQSWWSSSADGSDITAGGAREKVAIRNLVYTDKPGGGIETLNFQSPPNSEFFGLGVNQKDARTQLLNQLKVIWGDPLHSEPLMVNYGLDANGKEQNYVFVSNNGGMLHAIDTKDGSEKFAFMPYEMISKANEFTINRKALNQDNTRQTYGLDGSWYAWRQPGTKATDAPEKVYLYGGMRRGGSSYYALDVTTVTSPKLLWQITPNTTGFERLGQTWSKPKLARFPTKDGKIKSVVVFGGGYSPADHDRSAGKTAYPERSERDKAGNAIYAVDAETGALVWSASTPEMKWAIPGSIAVVDVDSDSATDFLYFADLGGQVFRVDIDDSKSASHKVVRIADLGGSGANHRRFYEQPTVAFVRDGNTPLLYVTVGSGYRAHPKNTATKEALFVIKDDSALGRKPHALATVNNLQDVTATPGIKALASGKRGWFYYLAPDGEKALSSPVVFDYQIMFTTYAPTEQQNGDVCSVRYGASYLHQVDLLTGRAVNTTEVDGVATPTRRRDLNQSTPPPSPTVLFGDDGKTSVVVGNEVIDSPLDTDRLNRLRKLRTGRWMQLSPDAAGIIKRPDESEAKPR